MIKIFITFFVIIWGSFFSYNVYASTSYTETSWRTNCSDTPTSWDNDNSWHKWIPITNDTSASESGDFDCEEHWYWDGERSDYKDKNVIYTCPDDRYASEMNCYDSSNNSVECTEDGSWWVKYKIYCKLRDDTYPSWDDLSSDPSDESYLKAVDNKDIVISADDNWGSPIVKITWKYEKHDDPWEYNDEISSDNDNDSSTKDKLETTENISLVDNNRNSNNYRQYLYDITEVCDEAGNCSSDVRIFKYNIYANYIYTDGSTDYSYISWEWELVNWNIAEWKEQNVKLYLKDKYKNVIVPVYESWWTTNIRKVWVKINYTNNDYFLDQYKKDWNSWLKIKWITDDDYDFSLTNTTTTKDNLEDDKNENSWIYTTSFKVYTPTNSEYNKAWGNFTINDFIAYTQDYWINNETTFSRDLLFKYKPIYYTQISGDLYDYWFVEWINQNSELSFVKSDSASENPDANIYFEFGSWARNISDKLNLFYSDWSDYIKINEWYSSLTTLFKDNLSSTQDFSLITKLLQELWETIDSIQNQYLSTHIKYSIDWYDIVYNSDIIWRNNYWDNNSVLNANQVWVKVLWRTHSKNQKDILVNQNENDIHVLGNLVKSSLKKDIRKNVYEVINNIVWDDNKDWVVTVLDWDNWTWNSWWKKIYDDKVIYYELDWWTIVLWDDSDEEVKWKKTIIIKWWNLYIKSNMHYNDITKDILWIVVLKNDEGKWWNLYIDPNVTKIVWSFYLDKAILSASDTNNDWEISSDELLSVDNQQEVLANQLYIKWQLFSENTLWWARKDPYLCPYFINDSDCDLKTAQMYDLNYLRRYFLYDKNNSWVIWDDWDEPANWWTNYKWIYDVSVYKYAKYPVVIDYNSIVQITPPPLFWE